MRCGSCLLLAVLLALGCVGDGALPIVAGPEALDLGEYRIQAGDLLDVSFALNPELSVQAIVRPDGRISLQMVGEVDAEGRTPSELKEDLRQAYAAELRAPEISVSVVSMAARIYVDGQVAKPGEYVWSRQITALQAVALAGGLRETATKDEIVVLRRTQSGAPEAIPIDLDDAKNGGESRDLYLAPYDLVVVPESGVAEMNRWVDQYIRKNIPFSPRDVIPPDGGGGGGGGGGGTDTPPTTP
ncbi:MAG: polysaccharide biosynthesis/export family protein [Myxococcota bacterium]